MQATAISGGWQRVQLRSKRIGLQGQYVYIDPATRTVIVKLSYFRLPTLWRLRRSAAFFAAASAWRPALGDQRLPAEAGKSALLQGFAVLIRFELLAVERVRR